MIGLFKITNKRDGETYIIAESVMTKGFIGRFYIPPIYRESCSNLSDNDTFFGILDDQSGYGAILYKVDDNITSNNALNLSNELKVNGNVTTNDHFKGTITLSTSVLSQIATAMVLTSSPSGGAVANAPVAPIEIKV